MTARRTALVIAAALLVPLVGTSPAAAATCPTVDAITHAVTPGPSIGADWSGCDLSGADLGGWTISGMDLAGADLSGADLQVATVSRTDLSGADLSGAYLGSVSIHSSDVTAASFAGAALAYSRGSALSGTPASMPAGWSVTQGYLVGPTATLDGADLSGADLAGRDLSLASLVGVRLDGADLDGTSFVHALLVGASVTRASMQGSALDDALLDGARSGRISGTPTRLPAGWTLTSGHLVGPGADLRYADLDAAVLTGRTLTDTDFFGASLRGADLSAADLRGSRFDIARLDQADLSHALLGATSLHGASLAGASLRSAVLDGLTDLGASGVDGADFTGAVGLPAANSDNVWWETTICPDGALGRRHDQRSCLTKLDTTAPTQNLGVLPAFIAPKSTAPQPSLALSSTAADAGSGLASVALRWRSNAPGEPSTGFATAPLQGGPTQSWTPHVRVGHRYCYSIRSTDIAGNVSPWSAERCTTVVADDATLVARAGWARVDPAKSPYYRRTRSTATKPGATLSTSYSSSVRSVAVLGTRCPRCGSVAVYVGRAKVGSVSFRSSGTVYRSLTTVGLPAARYGKVRLVVTSTRGRAVHIDGLAAS